MPDNEKMDEGAGHDCREGKETRETRDGGDARVKVRRRKGAATIVAPTASAAGPQRRAGTSRLLQGAEERAQRRVGGGKRGSRIHAVLSGIRSVRYVPSS